jgi:transcriptional regulator with XRE-family HTH domain
MAKERDSAQSGLALFAAELKAVRAKAGLSRDDLAARINYSPSLMSMIEGLRRAPTLDVAQRLDTALDTAGTFARLQQNARTTPLPSWFRPYAEIEATATQLRSWQPMVIDGLLQTSDYARALLSTRPNTSAEELDALVAARMERQAVLARDKPPMIWVVMDEAALQREIGGAKVMREQLWHLADLAQRPSVTVEVVPLSAGAHGGLTASFAIAEADDGTRVGYLDTASEGYIIESRSAVSDLMLTFDTLRSEAITRRGSCDLILKWAGGHDGPE